MADELAQMDGGLSEAATPDPSAGGDGPDASSGTVSPDWTGDVGLDR